jgi:hypothetical protein
MDKKTLDQYHNYEVKPDRSLAADLLAWYDQVKRNLPWRGDPDPYHIWVSEAMLQQKGLAGPWLLWARTQPVALRTGGGGTPWGNLPSHLGRASAAFWNR